MKRRTIKCMAVAVLCSFAFLATEARANEQDWDFIQSVGGMKLGTPSQKDGNWMLPVDIDISGTRAVTTKPTVMHSGMSCEGIQAETHGKNIYLALDTGIPWVGMGKAECPPIVLGHLPAGEYVVFYNGLGEEPVKVADITLTP